jgi:hypothetical protein
MPDLLDAGPLSAPVTVQLVNYQTGLCFDARYETPRRSDEAGFTAKTVTKPD